jgi:hypothetical protein
MLLGERRGRDRPGMSDTSQGNGWWLASDGKWYPPETWTGTPQTDAPPMPTYPVSGYQMPPGYAGYAPRPTNGLAVASLVCACAGIIPFFFGLPCVLGVIFGFVSRSQIRRSNNHQQGGGMALAGIIVGFSLIGLFILVVILIAAFGNTTHCNSFNGQPCAIN